MLPVGVGVSRGWVSVTRAQRSALGVRGGPRGLTLLPSSKAGPVEEAPQDPRAPYKAAGGAVGQAQLSFPENVNTSAAVGFTDWVKGLGNKVVGAFAHRTCRWRPTPGLSRGRRARGGVPLLACAPLEGAGAGMCCSPVRELSSIRQPEGNRPAWQELS